MSTQMRTRTLYDYPHLEELQRVGAKSFAKKMSIGLRIFLLLTGALDLAAGLYAAVNFDSPFVALFLCVVGTLLLIWGIFFFPIRAWMVKKTLNDPELYNEFVFSPDELAVYTKDREAHLPYTDCAMLLEAELSLYMILPNKQGMMMDKANLKGGSVDQLRAFLEEKCGQTTRWVGKKNL